VYRVIPFWKKIFLNGKIHNSFYEASSTMKAIINTKIKTRIVTPAGIQNGAKTQSHDQAITPVSFKTIKATPNKRANIDPNPIPFS
jgi:hypothetical protein